MSSPHSLAIKRLLKQLEVQTEEQKSEMKREKEEERNRGAEVIRPETQRSVSFSAAAK